MLMKLSAMCPNRRAKKRIHLGMERQSQLQSPLFRRQAGDWGKFGTGWSQPVKAVPYLVVLAQTGFGLPVLVLPVQGGAVEICSETGSVDCCGLLLPHPVMVQVNSSIKPASKTIVFRSTADKGDFNENSF